MPPLATIIRYEVLLFLGALALIISIQLLTGKINRRRLLHAKGEPRLALQQNKGLALRHSEGQAVLVPAGYSCSLFQLESESLYLPE